MSVIKKLASQTMTYGLSSMLGRFINFLLVIPHTEYLHKVNDYGESSTIFAYLAIFNIILTYGMETTFFYFIRKGEKPSKVFATAQRSLFVSTLLFVLIIYVFADQTASAMGLEGKSEWIKICLIFIFFDTLSALPYASLRNQEKPLQFALIKLINIAVNVSLTLWWLIYPPEFMNGVSQVSIIFLCNSIASIASFALLSPMVFKIGGGFDSGLYKDMLKYAWPLIFVGLAGMINETFDRTMIEKLLPEGEGSRQNGIYSAFYKLTMVMTMFVQAYRFAAEPLFFKQLENQDSRQTYAHVMYWFVGICSLIFLSCMLLIDPLAHLFIRNPKYFEDPAGIAVVPILLLANLFLGVYYNLGIWYRLTDNTQKGAVISILGALVTIGANLLLIPEFGFTACAWITLVVYFSMTVVSYFWGKKYYSVPYETLKIISLIIIAIVLWLLSEWLICQIHVKLMQFFMILLVIALMLLIIWLLQPNRKKP